MIGRRSSVLSTLVLALGAFTALDGCGAGGVGAAVRPKEATAAEGIGEGPCREADSSGEPLVVDWKPEQRGDLELLMKENVAIVSYSCKGFKLLKDCKVDGTYGFLGMSKKEQVVKLNNADEVKANLPLGGIGIAGSISAEMARGSTLDVAMIMVGKVKTTWAKVQADELKGECDGATHFVKGAMVGAFVMQTGTKGQVKSAAQMFGATASGASTSEKNVQNKDGDIGDCAKATPDDKKAPGQCQAFIRLELKGIIPKAAPAAGAALPRRRPPRSPRATTSPLAEADVPEGARHGRGQVHRAEVGRRVPLQSRRTRASARPSAARAMRRAAARPARSTSPGRGVSHDEKKARELLTKGCDGSDTKSCTNLGVLMMQGRGGAKDGAAAAKNFEKGCADADALACGMLGMQYKTGDGVTKDDAKAVALLQKGCEGGNDAACGTYGKMLLDGTGDREGPREGEDVPAARVRRQRSRRRASTSATSTRRAATSSARRSCTSAAAGAGTCRPASTTAAWSSASADRRTPRSARSRWAACATTRCPAPR